MNLSGLAIFDAYGIGRIPLSGDYTPESLADLLVLEWIPYFECHKCGRFEWCKFVELSPENPDQALDIKCGVFEAVIRNYVCTVFDLMSESVQEKRQSFLDLAFQLSQHRVVKVAATGLSQ